MAYNYKKLRTDAFDKLKEGDVRSAYLCISEIISGSNYTLDDLYLAGQWALDSGYYAEAINLLTRTLSESKQANETWYVDSAHIAMAYAKVLLGEYLSALEDLAAIQDDVELSWLINLPPVSKLSLLADIEKHRKPPLTP